MTAAGLRVLGFLCASGSRTAGFFKTATRVFHNSHWALKEVQTKPQPADQAYGRVEYIPRKKTMNPMTIVGIAWAIGLPSGIVLFLLTKRQVEKNRLKQLKIRQKIKASNEGEYAGERYKLATLKTAEVIETKT